MVTREEPGMAFNDQVIPVEIRDVVILSIEPLIQAIFCTCQQLCVKAESLYLKLEFENVA